MGLKLVLYMLLSSMMFAGQSWSMHVGALRKAVLFVLDGKECEDDALFSLNLLLQAGYDKSKQEELLGKLGASFKLIESVLGTLTMHLKKSKWQRSVLLKILTSLLSMHVGALRKAVPFVLDGKECKYDALFSLNLLLHV